MKRLIIHPIATLLIFTMGWTTAKAQQAEVPGDNFSLEGALELFKESATPREFEQMLNDPDTRVNNLDLNGDGYIDYIRVIDINEGHVHAFVIQAVVSRSQNQDIAVITLEKRGNGEAVLQITGDADIYGVETIIEPTREVRTYAGARSSRVVVNVWAWPSVRYVFGPHYRVWVSPWGWHYRPNWWHPWRPVVYYDYYSYWYPYRRFYTPCFTHRVVYAHHIYRPHRTTSVIVYNRHHDRITRYRSTHISRDGRYRPATSRTTSRQVSRAARYDSNGRIRSSAVNASRPSTVSGRRSTERMSSSNARIQRSESGARTQQSKDNYISRYRKSSDNERMSNRTAQRPTSVQRSAASSNRKLDAGRSASSSARKSTSGVNRSSSTRGTSRFESAGADARRSYSGSAGIRQRTKSPINVQRSTGRTSGASDIRRSSGRSGIQRSQGSTFNRSSASSSRSRSGGSAVKRGASPSRSSGIQRSSGRSSQRSSAISSRSSGRSSSGTTRSRSRGRR